MFRSFLFLAVIVFVLYANTFSNGFISDDNGITAEAPTWNFQTIIAQPQTSLRSLLYLVLYSFGGLSPAVFRLPNILFHLLNTWMIFALLARFVNKKTGLAAAALFAVHPIAVESVSWISGGGYAQYTLFLLSSLLAYIHGKNFFSLILAIFALLTSDKAIVLPAVFFLYEFTFGNLKKNWRSLLPFFFLAAIFIALLFIRVEGRLANLQTTFYQSANQFVNPLVSIPSAITAYLSLIFWPIPLSLYHPDPPATPQTLFSNGLVTFSYLVITVFSFFRARPLFFFLALFPISLAPTLTPLRVTWTVAERYAYLGSIGVIATTMYIVQKTINNKQTFLAIVSVVAILLSVRTIIRNADWNNEVSFWSATAKTAPALPNVHSNLAIALGQKGDYAGAIKEFQITTALKPDWVDPYYNLALTYQRAGQFASASATYHTALKLNPNLWQPYRNLAEIAFAEKRYDDAIKYLNLAIEKNPSNANLLVNLAIVYQAKSDLKNASVAVAQALAIDPNNNVAIELSRNISK